MKYTYEYVKNEFENRGYSLVSKEYVNVKTPLKYICNKHKNRGVQEIRYSNFLQGRGCPFCMIEEGHPPNHLPEVIYKEETEKMGYIYVSVEYKNKTAVINFICQKHKDKGVQQANWASIRCGKQSCAYCNGTNRTTEDFKKMMFDINPNIDILGEYVGARKRILCRCKIDGHIWNPLAYNLLSGFGCPICADRKVGVLKRTTSDEKMQKLIKMHPTIEFLSTPILSTDYVCCRCKTCGYEWSPTYQNLAKYHKPTGCPRCAGSNSEDMVADILDKWGYVYKRQDKFNECCDVDPLPFDFHLLDFAVLIEFDGEQHYHPIPRGKSDGIKEFEIIKKHDNIKDEYCKKNGIPLIRIPYWEREYLEYFLFDEFVKLKIIEEVKVS